VVSVVSAHLWVQGLRVGAGQGWGTEMLALTVPGRARGDVLLLLPAAGTSRATAELEASPREFQVSQRCLEPWRLSAVSRLRAMARAVPQAWGLSL